MTVHQYINHVRNHIKRRRSAQRIKGRKPARSARLQLEPLETRLVPSGSPWTPLVNAPTTGGIQNMILLSDGTVMALGNPNPGGNGASNAWFQLMPVNGNYVNGTWAPLQSMQVARLFFPANVLPNGNVFVVGGEFSSAGGFTNTADIYNSLTGVWASNTNSPIASFSGQANFGDDPTEVLPNGNVLTGGGAYNNSNGGAAETWFYNPSTNQWSFAANKITRTGPNNTPVYDSSDEEGWVKLKDGSILTFDNWASNQLNIFYAERYIPATNSWVDASNLDPNNAPSILSDSSLEIGAGSFLLPDGRAFFIGNAGNTAFYNPATNLWDAGPSIPGGLSAGDQPGAMLPNGDVLIAAGCYNGSTTGHIFEFNPITLKYKDVTPTTYNLNTNYPYMLVLPSGQVLLSDAASTQLIVYTPSGHPKANWQPTITSISGNGDGSATLTGTQLNGLSEGAGYGDDAQMSSNYPIIQLTDANGTVRYARTFNWSSTGVATGSTLESVQFTVPPGTPDVNLLSVITNGIASTSVLYVSGDPNGSSNSITLDTTTSFGFPAVTVSENGGATSTWVRPGSAGVYVAAGVWPSNGSSISVRSTLAGQPTFIESGAFGTVTLGHDGTVQDIHSNVTLEGTAGSGTIQVDDSQDSAAHTVTLKTVTINDDLDGDSDLFGQIGGLAPSSVTINYEYADTGSLTVNGGSANNTYNVQATGTTTFLSTGSGNDTVSLGKANSLLGIQSALTVIGQGGTDTLYANDQASTAVQAYSVNASVLYVRPVSLGITYSGVSTVVVNGSQGGSTYNIQSTAASTAYTINAGRHGDTFNISPVLENCDGLAGGLTLNGGGGVDVLNVDDQGNTAAATYSLNATVLYVRPFTLGITYSGVSTVVVNGGQGGSTCNIYSTASGTAYTLNGGTGGATFNVGNFSNSLDNIQGAVALQGQGGQYRLNVNDQGNAAASTYTMTSTTLARTGAATITYTGLTYGQSAIYVNAGSAGNGDVIDINGTVGSHTFIWINGGGNGNQINVLGSGLDSFLTLEAGVGSNNLIRLGSLAQGPEDLAAHAGTLANINGLVYAYDSGGTDNLIVDDSADKAAHPNASVAYTTITGLFPGSMYYGLTIPGSFIVYGGSGPTVWNIGDIQAYFLSETLYTGTGNDTVNVVTDDTYGHGLTVHGQGNTDVVNVNDQQITDTATYALTATSMTRTTLTAVQGYTPEVFTLNYDGITSLTVNGGSNTDTFTLSGALPANPITLNGGAAANALVGPNATNTWAITQANGGTLDSSVRFSDVGNLTGGTGVDFFKVSAAGTVTGINGGGAPAGMGDWLDYSSFTTAITVNLATGSATSVNGGGAGAVTNIQDVHAGNGGSTLIGDAQGNILIGGTGADTITGGTGRSLLIGGKGADQITGGSTSGGDILIGGSTIYDSASSANMTALMAILGEWQSGDSYNTRFTDINTGTIPGGYSLSYGTTVMDDGAANVVTGSASASALDWFFAGASDTLNNLVPGEHVNNS